MSLDGVLFLSGHTARGKAYAQAMIHRGLKPQWTILYGAETQSRPGQDARAAPNRDTSTAAVFLPDLSQSLGATLRQAGWDVDKISAPTVNDQNISARMRALSPRLVIFCGYGGEIVAPIPLSIAPFLHIHAGWLPDYRGSTTAYYSWIETGEIGATAILLDETIDTGAILMQRRYPLPPPGIDMDYLYDPALRADLLVRVLRHLNETGALPKATPQVGTGRTFYVIHPVLKHLALLTDGVRRQANPWGASALGELRK